MGRGGGGGGGWRGWGGRTRHLKGCGWHSHDLKKWETRMNRLFASWVPGCLLMIPIAGALVAAAPAGAADAGGPARGAQPEAPLGNILGTGAYIRRPHTESPPPVGVLTA